MEFLDSNTCNSVKGNDYSETLQCMEYYAPQLLLRIRRCK